MATPSRNADQQADPHYAMVSRYLSMSLDLVFGG